MKLQIPRLGDVVELSAPWKFELHYEDRNKTVWPKLGLPQSIGDKTGRFDLRSAFDPADIAAHNLTVTIAREWPGRPEWTEYLVSTWVELPAGTQLTIDRIYIRKGQPDFDSITFVIKPGTAPGFEKGKARFWAKLDHANEMECVDRV